MMCMCVCACLVAYNICWHHYFWIRINKEWGTHFRLSFEYVWLFVAVGESTEREKYVWKVCKFVCVYVWRADFNGVVRLAFISGQRDTQLHLCHIPLQSPDVGLWSFRRQSCQFSHERDVMCVMHIHIQSSLMSNRQIGFFASNCGTADKVKT